MFFKMQVVFYILQEKFSHNLKKFIKMFLDDFLIQLTITRYFNIITFKTNY